MVSDRESCARLLRKVWIINGTVAASAFNLRSNIHEAYISLLREEMPSFYEDILSITKDNPISYASLQVNEVRNINISKDIAFDIQEVDNEKLKSHCGLYVYVNGQRMIGGEPFVTKEGESVNVIILQIKLALAKFASKSIKLIQRRIKG